MQRLVNFLLLIIVLSGLTLRLWDVNMTSGIGSHPDERSTACFYAPTINMPASWDEFWEPKQSPLNPLWDIANDRRRSFTYGHFPLYLGVLMGESWHLLAPTIQPYAERFGISEAGMRIIETANRDCWSITIAGRFTIALLDTLTILLMFALGRVMFGRVAGLVAAALYAFTAQAVQLSHFFAMDPASTTFTVMAVIGAVLMVKERTWRAAIIAGLGAGLAIASKFSALPILGVPIVAAIVILWRDWADQRKSGILPDGRKQLITLLSIPLTLILAGAIFFVTSPYAILDWENFAQATLVEQGRMVRGVADMPFTRQYRNTTPYIYFLEQQFNWGLGWPLGVVIAIGMLFSLVDLLTSLATLVASLFTGRGNNQENAKPILTKYQLYNIVIWSWIIAYFGLTGAFLAKFNRYMLPLLPFFSILGVGMIWQLWTDAKGDADKPNPLWWVSRAVAVLFAIVAIVGGLFWSTAYVNGVYNKEHTWISSSRWVYENVPSGSLILWELWDDPLPKSIPNEPGMDLGSTGLRNIDWSPYEEDTPEKYEIMKAKLREADYVAYSSKRIYDSVDELPERYPMTTLYYESMWNGDLGFELALDQTSPPQLFDYVFQDREADESWSLYDHPQVTIFRKVRDLTDAEYDAIFVGTWEQAIPWYRGQDSPLSPFLNALGLGSSQESEKSGLINNVIGSLTGEESPQTEEEKTPEKLLLDQPLSELPVVDNYRWNRAASEAPDYAVGWWWLVVAIIGWVTWPISFVLFNRMRDRGYLFSRTLGWLLGGWLLWLLTSVGILQNTVVYSWLTVVLLAAVSFLILRQRGGEIGRFAWKNAGFLIIGELIFVSAYLFFVWIRTLNPDIWQPWFGGEKFMEFAFLNGILRSPTFPPVDPHFAGGVINYYYFGIYLVAYLIKLTGIYAEVAFNLSIPTLFALTVVNTYAIAYSAYGYWQLAGTRQQEESEEKEEIAVVEVVEAPNQHEGPEAEKEALAKEVAASEHDTVVEEVAGDSGQQEDQEGKEEVSDEVSSEVSDEVSSEVEEGEALVEDEPVVEETAEEE
ncbi:MAG: DUF2298 domain-containing protein, partial [Chloroflexota bacterium]